MTHFRYLVIDGRIILQLTFEENNFKVSTRGLFIGIGIKSKFGFSSENSWSEIENLTFWVIIISPRTALFSGASFLRGCYIP
jgi:hypothetical protein